MYKGLAVLLVVGALCVGLPLLRSDKGSYEELVRSSEPQKVRALCQQARDGVSKQVWSLDAHYCAIESRHSELFFFTDRGEVDVIEELEDVECLVQECLYYKEGAPMQTVRFLRAKEASYNYFAELFEATGVKMWTYELPGHEPPKSVGGLEPTLVGRAERVDLKLKGRAFDLNAHHFQGTMR
ncbi:MAG: hypothetical protein H7A36_00940 [Chlamydiales bacterium]|nr:hypothetical protein [Chlamydiales bacterium]